MIHINTSNHIAEADHVMLMGAILNCHGDMG